MNPKASRGSAPTKKASAKKYGIKAAPSAKAHSAKSKLKAKGPEITWFVAVTRESRRQVLNAKARRDAADSAKIIERITPWAGSSDQASAWYRSQPIPAFGNRTAEALVRAGKSGLVHEYLDSIAIGGFA
jgi:hypothetical protein